MVLPLFVVVARVVALPLCASAVGLVVVAAVSMTALANPSRVFADLTAQVLSVYYLAFSFAVRVIVRVLPRRAATVVPQRVRLGFSKGRVVEVWPRLM